MTERLSTLLREEAAALHVPAPAAAEILATGHRLRRRNRVTAGVASAAVLVVVAGGVAVGLAQDGGKEARDIGPTEAPGLSGAAFTVGTTVYLEDGTVSAQIDDKAVKSSYFTSAGLLVRHGKNNFSDGGGPQRFSLVTPDGTVKSVSVVTEETVPGVDPEQPYLAYTEVVDGVVQVVVHDVSTDEEVARVPMPGDFTWGGWSGPPVALSGDTVYVGTDEVAHTVNWRTGEVAETKAIGPGYPDIAGGRALEYLPGSDTVVVDVATGEELLRVPTGDSGYLDLSPDGRFATQGSYDGDESFKVFDIDAGTSITIDGTEWDFGWSADGDLVRLADGHLVTCSTATGECTQGTETIPLEGGGVEPKDVRFAGQTYES